MMRRLAFLLTIVLFFSGCVQEDAKPAHPQACFPDGSCVSLEVVATSGERARGLMYRESLNPDAGMLFVFPQEAKHAFWMKNTRIPLDIIWLKKDGTVVDVAENVLPCKSDPCRNYIPKEKAEYVIEVNANQSKKRGAVEGATIILQYKK